jgi:CheY-like chemotaxis protein
MSADSAIKILLVEDTPVVRKMEVRVLKKIGFSDIIEADDGEEAIAKLADQEKIDLIISDWNMPKKSGYELLTWVRSQEKYRHIPFIMVTSQAEKKQSDKAFEAGATDFVSKPFEVTELKEVIDKAFGKQPEPSFQEASIPRKAAPGKTLLKVAHIQITDHLPLGVLKYLINHQNISPRYFELETRCMSGWNPVRQALETGDVDAAFVLAPIAMDLFSADVPIRLVLFAHKNGSICIQNVKHESRQSFYDYFKGKIFYIPHLLSVHHLLADIFLREIGLNPGLVGKDGTNVFFEVVPPIKNAGIYGQKPHRIRFYRGRAYGEQSDCRWRRLFDVSFGRIMAKSPLLRGGGS